MIYRRFAYALVLFILIATTGYAAENDPGAAAPNSVNPASVQSGYADVKFDINHINNCVFEVIVPKPENDPITYEKPLPLDQLPFQVRNDKYYPVGTAFALSGKEFATAAHVLNLSATSHFKAPLMRDIKGNVFQIDKVVKYSSRRDFVVFTVKGKQDSEYFETNQTPEIGEKVFAVGNALGQGVAIRDGLHTSNTPEEIDGKWNWIRFSAAASPGNSGGPLLDKNGKVLGVILSKSPNENLNYALPISEVKKDYDNNAEIFLKAAFGLELFDFVKTGELNTQTKLPMSYDDLKKACKVALDDFFSKMRNELLAENKENIFPNGSGSDKVMYADTAQPFPQVITRREGGNWEATHPKDIKSVDLDNNGKISYGGLSLTLYAKFDRPDNISLNDVYKDSKLFMDLVLKALDIPRWVGRERIRITSLGKADNEYVHVDNYGRKWLVKTWPLDYADYELAAFILPVPDGCAIIMKIGKTGSILDDQIKDMATFTDFVNVSYNGTFKQWREFLEMKDLIPPGFGGIQMELNNGNFSYASRDFQAKCDSNNMKITDSSILTVLSNFRRNEESVSLEVSGIMLKEGKFEKTEFGIARHRKAFNNDEKYSDFWQRVVDGKKPFDKQILIKDDATSISTVFKQPGGTQANADLTALYSVRYMRGGVISQEEMESGLDKLMQNVIVHEN